MDIHANTSEAFEALKEYMKRNFNVKIASGGKEIVKRCHFCGDSINPSDAHLYIGLKNGIIKYNCFKCNAGGTVDSKFLRDIECYDENIINLCLEQNKDIINSNSLKMGKLENFSFLKNISIPISNNEFAQKKLQYISKRMGYIFNFNDAIKFKIILNLKEFLIFNNIDKWTRHPNIIDLLDKFFIGFLSMDNKYIIMRRLIDKGKLPKEIDTRYVVYSILSSNNGMKHYVIPGSINLNYPLDIHIAEGAFDILSIYLNVAPIGSNGIFAAIGGKSYMNLVEFFILNYGFCNFNLHLYPDSDIDTKDIIYIKNKLKIFKIKCFMHRNSFNDEKDYGVSKNRIIDEVVQLK